MTDTMAGGCACGKVRYTAQVHNDEAYLCHCRMCQRATGSVSIAFKNMKKADVAWESEPDWYRSSPIARRPYCAACGTSLGFAFPDSENMDLTIGVVRRSGAFQAEAPFRRRRACTAPGSTPKACREYRVDEYQAARRALDERRWQAPRLSATSPPPDGDRASPGTSWAEGREAGRPPPRPVLQRRHQLDPLRPRRRDRRRAASG